MTFGLLLFFGLVCHISATEGIPPAFWVSPQGSDANPGTKEQPFATIQKAVDSTSRGLTNDRKIIHLKKGTYFLTEPIHIKQIISLIGAGEASNPPEVTISGGRKITGFKEVKKGLVVADVPEAKDGKWNFRDLYVKGERAIRAREPNTGYFRIEKSGEDRRTNFIYNEGDLKNWKDLENVELVFLHDWSITRCPIKEINEAERRLTVPHRIGCDLEFFKIDGWEPHPRYFVENSVEFLDAPGEWFLDTKEGKLYYRLKKGETAKKLEVIAPVLTQLLIVEGPIAGGDFKNIRFAHAAYFPKQENTVWETQAAAFSSPGEPGSSQRFLPSPAAVHCEFAHKVSVENCLFEHLGENGLWFAKGCSSCNVTNSQFRDIGANGVMIGTHNHADTVTGCTIEHSVVEKTGQTLFGSVGIWVGITQKTDIRNNVIRQTPYTGISLGWQWNPNPTPARENRIAGNRIYDCMQILSDGGGIYTLGFQPDSVIEGNVIYGIPHASGRAESNGMFIDEGSTDFTIKNNVVYNTEQSSLRFHQAGKNLVQDNILSNKEGVPMIRYNATPKENIESINNRDLKPDSQEFQAIVEELMKRQ